MHQNLARSSSELADRYAVVVVGSGYGGSIAGARLADRGYQVCIVERGREWKPGDFPDTATDVAKALHSGERPYGLYDYRRNEHVDVLLGCGIGGTSLINAGVTIKPQEAVFKHPRWPRELRDPGLVALDPYFARVLDMLAVARETRSLRKVEAHERSASGGHGSFRMLDVAVNFERFNNKPNAHGVLQRKCEACGDCLTGCNVGAKNTLDVNYLPFAKKQGAEIFAGVRVEYLTKASGGGFFVHCRLIDSAGDFVGTKVVHAHAVVLAAGALGSPEILLRSRQRGLAVSERLGCCFSGNGDILGFGYNNDLRTDIMGFGNHEDEKKFDVGPLIASVIDYRSRLGANGGGFIIEEGCIPRALVDLSRAFLPGVAAVVGHDSDSGVWDELQEGARVLRDVARAYDAKGALNHSMVYLGMGHDRADGVLGLDPKGNIRIHWETAPDEPIYQRIAAELQRLTARLGGTALRNESWVPVMGGKVVTVHPLGGCAMGQDASIGVVDHRGRVFDPSGPDEVHEGLYVLDGSIVPTSIGANPLLTISALAERAADLLLRHDGLPKKPRQGSLGPVTSPAAPVGLEFTEEMKGHISYRVTGAKTPDEYKEAEQGGRRKGATASVKLTIFVEDIDHFISSAAHQAVAIGSVEIGGDRHMVDRGVFNLFVDSDDGKSKRMLYSLRFMDEAGEPRLLEGFKLIRDDPGLDPLEIWRDATTLFVTLRNGFDGNDPVLAQGIIRIQIADFLKQLTTFRVHDAPDLVAEARAIETFMRFFFEALWEKYAKHRF